LIQQSCETTKERWDEQESIRRHDGACTLQEGREFPVNAVDLIESRHYAMAVRGKRRPCPIEMGGRFRRYLLGLQDFNTERLLETAIPEVRYPVHGFSDR
jgi:hypothetical protein